MSVFVARTGTDIGFEQHPCLEPLGCRRPSGMHEGQYRFACFRVESDHVLDHQRSPLLVTTSRRTDRRKLVT
jgi:hypothetical protein